MKFQKKHTLTQTLTPTHPRPHVHSCPQESLSFAVVVLVASIPLAVEIVTTTTLAMGSRMLSK